VHKFKVYFSWLSEALVVIIALFVINNYLVRPEFFIKADGKGYYDYLPAAFIYNDLNFEYTDTLQTEFYDQKSYTAGYLHTVNGHQINKYFPGVAVLWMPFFAAAHTYALYSDMYAANGYSQPYQESIFYAAVFFLFWGLFFLRKLLESFTISPPIIFLTQLTLVLATPLIHYVHFEPAFTHVYNFALITGFVYFFRNYVQKNTPFSLWMTAVIFALILIIRPVNGLAVGLVFLAFNSFDDMKEWIYGQFHYQYKNWIIPFLSVALIVSLVPLLWYHQTGSFLVWGYQNEGFNFSSPAIWSFLFSFQKGAFLLTPVLFISLVGGLWAWKKQHQNFWIWSTIGFLAVVIYVLSSWWAWWYGASFGSRPLIDFYVLFALLMAVFFQEIKRVWAMMSTALVMILLLSVNLIQAVQYQTYIIDWAIMDFEKYKTIGLHIDQKYRGIFYRPSNSYAPEQVVFSFDYPIDSLIFPPGATHYFPTNFLNSAKDSLRFNRIFIESDMEFQDGTAQFILVANDASGNNVYWHAEGVFGSVLDENLRSLVRIPYRWEIDAHTNEIGIGVDTQTDALKVYSLRVVGVLQE
jgi:hypothetical protein